MQRALNPNVCTMTTKSRETPAADSTQKAVQDALKFFEDALKSGIQLQEESIKFWKDVLEQTGSPEELRKKLESLTKDSLPLDKQRLEDITRVFQDSAKQCTDLFAKTMSLYQVSSPAEGQDRLQDLVETSLSALRSNVHAVVDMNSQMTRSWDDMLNRK